MLSRKKNKAHKGSSILFCIKIYTLLFIVFLISFSLLAYPEYASEGVESGIRLCFERLIPALFPFMIISSFLLKSNIYKAITSPLQKIAEGLFRLPGVTLPVIFMSFIAGYPIGAIMTSSLLESKRISYDDAKHLMAFCINPSISFCMSFIGSYLYKSTKAGLIIYLSTIIPSLITGIVYGISKRNVLFCSDKKQNTEEISLSAAFNEAITESTSAISLICVTVIIFSCVLNISQVLIPGRQIHSIISFLLEITNFSQTNCETVSVYIISAAVSFGGLCTHFQLMPYLIKMKISYKHFLFFRLINTFFSYFISRLLFTALPSVIPTAANGFNKTAVSNAGIPVSCILIIMSAIIIFTDNAITRIKNGGKI